MKPKAKMSRGWSVALALLLAAPLAAAVSKGLDEELNLDVVKASGTFNLFAQIAGLEPVIDPAIAERKLTLRIEKVRVRTALDAACDSLECRWRVEGGKLIVEAKPRTPPKPPVEKSAQLDEPIDLKVTKARAADVLRTFGEILSVEVDIEDGVAGDLTLDLEATPVRAALDAVCKKLSCRWHIEEGTRRRLVFSVKK
ncbi:MAG TPA: hypothetical protein VN851_26945 [Thermoanaerobaculia bacterium]|nr:hypothetical protein [Thermoanaerobaculia bacterium]